VLGQSNVANNSEHAYTVLHSTKVQNLNPFNDKLYLSVEPMLGATGAVGSWLNRCGDVLIDAAAGQRVIWCPAPVGGSTFHQWSPRGPLNHRLGVAIRRCRAASLPVSGILLHLGETDAGNPAADQAVLTQRLLELIASSRGFGCFAPWFIAQVSWAGGLQAGSAAVRGAQAAVVNGVDVFSWMDTDTIGAGGRYDNVHWNDTGDAAVAELAKTGLINSGVL
jgi:hypothetical protein